MGLVTDVEWECPGCKKKNIAQLYGHFETEFMSNKAIPSEAELKWNPPCENCGQFRLTEPQGTLVEFPIERLP